MLVSRIRRENGLDKSSPCQPIARDLCAFKADLLFEGTGMSGEIFAMLSMNVSRAYRSFA